jgi:hypothetical protein
LSETSAKSEESGNNNDEIPLEKLWIDKLARITRCDYLAKKLFNKPDYGIYLLLFILFLFTDVILQSIAHIIYGWNVFQYTPLIGLTSYTGLYFGVWGIRQYRKFYYRTLQKLQENHLISSSGKYTPIAPLTLRIILLICGFILISCLIYSHIAPIIQDPSIIGNPESRGSLFSQGWIHGSLISTIWITFYVPIVTEFVSLFIGIHVIFAIRLQKNKLNIKLENPMYFDEFRSIGFLFMRSVELYYIGVTLFLVCALSSAFRMGVYSIAFFVGAVIFGFILFFSPQITIHNYIHREKERLLISIKRDLLMMVPKDDIGFMHYYVLKSKYDLTEKIREYPFDILILRELVFAAIIPISAEIIIRLSSGYFGF